jgi:serine/threonine protein kinase
MQHLLCRDLQYLHEHEPPIIHRDISAKNILLDGARVKISDLGQAKFVDFADRQTVAPGAVVYSAPEVRTRPTRRPSPFV